MSPKRTCAMSDRSLATTKRARETHEESEKGVDSARKYGKLVSALVSGLIASHSLVSVSDMEH